MTPWSTRTNAPYTLTPTPGPGTPTADFTQTEEAKQSQTATAAAQQTENAAGQTATAIAQMTATALGTPGPGGETSTPGPGGGTTTPEGSPGPGGSGTGTPTPGVGGEGGWNPEQSPPGNGAPCVKPDSVIDIAGWIGYYKCEALDWVSWGDGNTEQLQHLGDGLANYEPFGTVNEIGQTISDVQSELGKYDWINTGLQGTSSNWANTVSLFGINGNPSPYNGGQIYLFSAPGPAYHTTCVFATAQQLQDFYDRFGTGGLSQGMCWIFDLLYERQLMPWLQALINASCIIGIALSFKRNFIDKAMM
jgi:hypothetical protein